MTLTLEGELLRTVRGIVTEVGKAEEACSAC